VRPVRPEALALCPPISESDAGFHDRNVVRFVDLEDPVHSIETQQDPSRPGRAPAGKAGAGAARGDGDLVFVGHAKEPRDLVRRRRTHDEIRKTGGGGQALVVLEIVFDGVALEDAGVPHDGPELVASFPLVERVLHGDPFSVANGKDTSLTVRGDSNELAGAANWPSRDRA